MTTPNPKELARFDFTSSVALLYTGKYTPGRTSYFGFCDLQSEFTVVIAGGGSMVDLFT
jgi:hypothetical protein